MRRRKRIDQRDAPVLGTRKRSATAFDRKRIDDHGACSRIKASSVDRYGLEVDQRFPGVSSFNARICQREPHALACDVSGLCPAGDVELEVSMQGGSVIQRCRTRVVGITQSDIVDRYRLCARVERG